ncbi:glycine zipper 2TM domain-containing protein [Massilia niastensis]|uniref:glycine zipper 2TM domain-containing protein n=1 Tax=Massilia niastensis TaxID=544911 RepID=UPI00039EC9F7|nr:glycine zipper 2TM domain-containing protein [Massilia niastensis]
MHVRTLLCTLMVALAPVGAMLGSAPAQAQPGQLARAVRPAGPVINGFNVEEVRRLAPGVELHFELYGSPGGTANLRIDGATRNLHLTEVEPGQYTGTYTIGTHDRIRPESGVTANLRLGNQVATNMLSESLIRGDVQRRQNGRGELASLPRIERFDVQGSPDLGPGNELRFTVNGTPGARVEVAIAGARGVFFLPEVRQGEYSAVYTVRNTDRIQPDSRVTATIRAEGRYSTTVLGQPLLARNGYHGGQGAPREARYCTNCAVVEAVNVIEVSGDGNYLGTIGGAVAGGLLGSQVGSGSGRKAATVAGAVGGALAGRQIEKNMRSSQRYEVVVRYANSGATQAIQYENDPGFRAGDRVRVNGGVLARDQ